MPGFGALGQWPLGEGLAGTPSGFLQPLSIPTVRTKLGLRASQQMTAAAFFPLPVITVGWFQALSMPPRFKAGLRTSLQQFLAWPSQLRPTPSITGVLSALETKDVMLVGGTIFNVPTSAEIGVISNTAQPVEIGIVQTGQSGTIASVSISVRIV